jgi:2-oxoglutarate/2-oxoacid ferredoxin oxidoreductase subunit alpha
MSDMTEAKNWNWKIAGQAGEGVMVASKMVAKLAKRHGLSAFNYLEYPSLIKGGHQTGQVCFSKEPIFSQIRSLDILIAFGQASFTEHAEEITEKTLVIYNSNAGELNEDLVKQCKGKIINLPLNEFARKTAKTKLATNMVAFGITVAAFGFDQQAALSMVEEEFSSKGEEIVKKNHLAFTAGFEAFLEQESPISSFSVDSKDNQVLMTGNEAVGLGAVAGGLQYYSAYPMTPASAAMHFLADQQKNYPLVVKHVEDEIAAINQALGASYAGVRSMTGTAGGGFALMVEGLSLSGVTELPVVILYGQRPGPATGLPTWTSQADLQFVLRAGHGEFQRIVLSPGTIEEHYLFTKQAFDLAEKYQVPVFIISDKYALESHQTFTKPEETAEVGKLSFVEEKDLKSDNSFRRYSLTNTKDGVSLRSVPGQEHGLYISNSYEHDAFGYATEDATLTIKQTDKRASKYNGILEEIPKPILLGKKDADVTFICWGSTVNVLKDVVSQTDKANVIHLPCVWPFPVKEFTELAKKAKSLVMVEGNATGQAEQLIRQETGITMNDNLRRYDGRPFYAEDIIDWLEQ